MHVSKGNLVDEGLNPHLVLPFLLLWYGWLSKEQGDIAKRQRLIFVKDSAPDEIFGGFAHLTNRGKHQLKNRMPGVTRPNLGFAYASYLRAYGLLSGQRYYLFGGSALGLKSDGFDLYDNCEKHFGDG